MAAPYRKPLAAIGSSSSSEEDTSSSSGDEHESEQNPTTDRFILAPARPPACQESESDEEEDDGDGDDEGEPVGPSTVAAKRGPSPPLHLQGLLEPHTPHSGNVPSPKLTRPSPLKRTATAAELAEPSSSKKKPTAGVLHKSPPPEKPAAAEEEDHTKSPKKAVAAKEVTKLQEKAVPAKKVAKVPKKAVAAKKVAKTPPLKTAAAGKEVIKPPPPSKAAAAAAVARQAAGKEVGYSKEKHSQEKTETYWYLAQEVKVLEKEHNTAGMLTAAFLNMADDEAAKLNAKIKKQQMAAAKLFYKRCAMNKELTITIFNLLD